MEFPSGGHLAAWLQKNTKYQVDEVGRIVGYAKDDRKWEDDSILVTFRRGVFTLTMKS